MKQTPDFLYPTPFKYLNPRKNYGIIKRKVDIGEGYENYFTIEDEKIISRRKIKMEWIPLDELPNRILQYCKRYNFARKLKKKEPQILFIESRSATRDQLRQAKCFQIFITASDVEFLGFANSYFNEREFSLTFPDLENIHMKFLAEQMILSINTKKVSEVIRNF